jgi:hypothetical protein
MNKCSQIYFFFYIGFVESAELRCSGLIRCLWRIQILAERKVMYLLCIWESNDASQRSTFICRPEQHTLLI